MNLDFNPKALVQSALNKGWCTKPGHTPRRSDRQILTLKRHAQGLNARGRKPVSPIYGVPRGVAELLTDFLRQFTEPFVVLDFQLFLTRSNINLKSGVVSTYLSRAVEAGILDRVGSRPSLKSTKPNSVFQSAKSAVSNS